MKKLIVLLLLSSNVVQAELSDFDINWQNEKECLAINLYHEARSESMAGIVSVAMVVINRTKSAKFPNNICDVVQQGPLRESWKTSRYPDIPDTMRIFYPIRGKCHFSWWCDGKSDTPLEEESYRRMLDISDKLLEDNYIIDITEGADHYFATWIDVEPEWAKHMTYIGTIDNHKFYKSIN